MDTFTIPKKAPGVVVWYRIFCVATVLMYVLCAIYGVALLAMDPSTLDAYGDELTELRITGGACLVVGLPLAAFYFVAALLPARPWCWVVGLVAIVIAMTGCCCVPAAIPLLIFWVKPETKAHYGRA